MSNTIGSIKFKNQYKNNVDIDGNYNILAPDGSKLLSFTSGAGLANSTVKQAIDAKANTTDLTNYVKKTADSDIDMNGKNISGAVSIASDSANITYGISATALTANNVWVNNEVRTPSIKNKAGIYDPVSVESGLDFNNNAITNVSTINGVNIGSLNSDVAINSTQIVELNGTVETNTANISTLQGQQSSYMKKTADTALDMNSNAITNALTVNGVNIGTLNTAVSVNALNITNIDGRTTTNTTNISTLQDQQSSYMKKTADSALNMNSNAITNASTVNGVNIGTLNTNVTSLQSNALVKSGSAYTGSASTNMVVNGELTCTQLNCSVFNPPISSGGFANPATSALNMNGYGISGASSVASTAIACDSITSPRGYITTPALLPVSINCSNASATGSIRGNDITILNGAGGFVGALDSNGQALFTTYSIFSHTPTSSPFTVSNNGNIKCANLTSNGTTFASLLARIEALEAYNIAHP